MKHKLLPMLAAVAVIMALASIAGAMPVLAQGGDYQACDGSGDCYPAACDAEEEICEITIGQDSILLWLWCEGDECWACDDDDICLYLEPGESAAAAPRDMADTAGIVPAGSGETVADLGFQPTEHGFNFPNYGNDVGPINLTPAEMQRMFGDIVCANTAGGSCTLTPPAKAWMDEQNEAMGGGHCEGLAVLSLLFYTGQESETEFGAGQPFDLNIYGNQALQRELAYWWATQSPTFPEVVRGTPAELLDIMIDSFEAGGSSETYTLAIYKRDGTGGHSILPYGVEDLGDDQYSVLIYDNNYPGETRTMLIDRSANRWQYEASINPSVEPDLYEGDAETGTLELAPTSVRLGNLYCYFCGENSQASVGKIDGLAQALPQQFVEISVKGPVKLLLTDEDGNELGWKDRDTFVTDIPDADYVRPRFSYEADWEDMPEFTYRVPSGVNFSIVADGTWLDQGTSSALNIIGAGFNLWIDDLYLDPGQQDLMYFNSDPANDWYELTYSTEYAESPEIGVGLETDESDWEFYVRGADVLPGDEFTVGLDYADGSFYITTAEAEEWSEYEFYAVEFDDEGEYLYGLDGIEMEPNENLYFAFVDPEAESGEYVIEFQDDETGEMLDTLALEDLTDQFDEWYYAEPDPTGALYTDPSGSFVVGVPPGWTTEEIESGILLAKEASVISAFSFPGEEVLTEDTLLEVGDVLLENALAEAIDTLEIDEESIEVDEESYYLEFAFGGQNSPMAGAMLMGQDPETLEVYGLLLLTDNMQQVGLDWQHVWSSFAGNPETAPGLTYIHPTYAFQMDIPLGWVYENTPAGAVFATENNMITPFYTYLDETIDGENMAANGQTILDRAVSDVGKNVAIDPENVTTTETGFSAGFTFNPTYAPKSEGVGVMALDQDPDTNVVYGLILLTSEPTDGVLDIWTGVIDSFQPLAEDGEPVE